MNDLYQNASLLHYYRSRLTSLFIQDSLSRLSAKNALSDYKKIASQGRSSRAWCLHSKLEEIRRRSALEYGSYDYGNGYYYQSMQEIGITGYRNTSERVVGLDLHERLSGKSVLDIGSNTGFLLLSLAESIKSGVGIEFNPFLVEAAELVSDYCEVDNITFRQESFENFTLDDYPKFDCVLSLANHSTYDGNTKQSIDDYFQRIHGILKTEGILVFESHPPEIEPGSKLAGTLNSIENYFNVVDRPALNMKGFMDRNRTYLVAQRK